jgi:succinate dehydrogenase / fumarate reductase cytochrome b subunit
MVSKFLSTSIGKKLGMALTGLLLYGFLIGHLAGNLLLLKGDGGQAFNAYSDFLIGHPLLVPVEVGLLAIFVLHVYLAIRVTHDNRRARPLGYQSSTQAVGGRTLASSTMIYSGIVLLVFVVLHLLTFKYGDRGGGTLFDLVTNTFKGPVYAIGYTVAMVVMGSHLWHAFQSAFQTMGLDPHRAQKLRTLGAVLGAVLALGFAGIPLWFFLVK